MGRRLLLLPVLHYDIVLLFNTTGYKIVFCCQNSLACLIWVLEKMKHRGYIMNAKNVKTKLKRNIPVGHYRTLGIYMVLFKIRDNLLISGIHRMIVCTTGIPVFVQGPRCTLYDLLTSSR